MLGSVDGLPTLEPTSYLGIAENICDAALAEWERERANSEARDLA
jgi:hypothetical protein